VSGPPAGYGSGSVSGPPAGYGSGSVSGPPAGYGSGSPAGYGSGSVSGPPGHASVPPSGSGPPYPSGPSGPSHAQYPSAGQGAPQSPGSGRASVRGVGPGGPQHGGLGAGPRQYPAGAPAAGRPARKPVVLAAIAVVAVLLLGLGGYGLIKLRAEDTDSPSDTSASDGDTRAPVDRVHPNTDWASNATAYEGQIDMSIAYDCPAEGTIGTVWGSGPYTTDSSVCTAAVHNGQITLEGGGKVVIYIRAGQDLYEGTNAHGIETTNYGSYESSFDFG
jgi:hypothetical protein